MLPVAQAAVEAETSFRIPRVFPAHGDVLRCSRGAPCAWTGISRLPDAPLQEPGDPLPYEVPHHSDAQAHDEHVHAAAEHAAAGEEAARGADAEVGEHGYR